MGWEDFFLPVADGVLMGLKVPNELVYESRQPKMTSNHLFGARCLAYCNSQEHSLALGEAMQAEKEEHGWDEQLSTAYSEHRIRYACAALVKAVEYRDDARISLLSEWLKDEAYLYFFVATPNYDVVTAASRSGKPWSWGQGSFLRVMLGEEGRKDKRQVKLGYNSASPVTWSISVAKEASGLSFDPDIERSVHLRHPLVVYYNKDGHVAWSPVLDSAAHPAQLGAYANYKWLAVVEGPNPNPNASCYYRKPGSFSGTVVADEEPKFVTTAQWLYDGGRAEKISFGPVDR